MDAQEFMQDHADKAVAGRIAEVMGDLTPEALGQVGALMAGAPNPLKGNKVVALGKEGEDQLLTSRIRAIAAASRCGSGCVRTTLAFGRL